ncbi:HD domain-containing protein [Weissella paramesenteroides]|uniref:HD domain-containing protein n=1 Tax=Weissella paramesenteroides TaxID=1249 RepID=UPI002E7B837A|nr:HD domain-containing protein [Weissella paramesenteroides]WPQ67804.1 HD family phosphohydrolase [Weissella paramesenteroides]
MDEQVDKQLAAITDFTAQVLTADQTGHDMTHILRVLNMTQHILTTEPTADAFIAQAAAVLHDTYDDKLFDDVDGAKLRVVNMLTTIGVSQAQQLEIFTIIDNMSWSKQRFGNPVPLTLAGQIVQDADRLDAIGAIAIARVIQYGVAHGHELYNPDIKPRQVKTKAEYRQADGETIMNHFYEKLFLLKDYLNTDEGKRIGEQRDKLMHEFVTQFELEWQQKDY